MNIEKALEEMAKETKQMRFNERFKLLAYVLKEMCLALGVDIEKETKE